MQAARGGDSWTLSGTKMFVVDGHSADVVLVAARTGVAMSLFAVERNAPGLSSTPLATMDQTRKQARLDFAATPARLIGVEGSGWDALGRMLDLATVALAAEAVGGAQKCLEMSVEYAKLRVQFGRPIGSFQAIKHKSADMLVEVESAKSAAYYAMWAASEGNDELPVVASLAKAYCGEAYFHTAAENIQIHGGIGFTWEHPAHLYFRAGQELRAHVRRSELPSRASRSAHRNLAMTGRVSVRGRTGPVWRERRRCLRPRRQCSTAWPLCRARWRCRRQAGGDHLRPPIPWPRRGPAGAAPT